jgi:hypothetical protein
VTSVGIVFFAHASRRFIDSGRRSLYSRFGRQVDDKRTD